MSRQHETDHEERTSGDGRGQMQRVVVPDDEMHADGRTEARETGDRQGLLSLGGVR